MIIPRESLNSSIWSIDVTTTQNQCVPGSNGNDRLFHVFQSYRTWDSAPNGLMSFPEHLLGWPDLTLLQRCYQRILQT